MTSSYSRGHLIIYVNGIWIYEDNKQPLNNHRPCKKCGCKPTSEGYDACLGYIKGATSVCCGHGVEEGYIKYE